VLAKTVYSPDLDLVEGGGTLPFPLRLESVNPVFAGSGNARFPWVIKPNWLIPNETAQSATMIALPIYGFFAFLPIAMPPASAKMTAMTEASTMPTTEASTMPTTASTVATASSTMCESGGGCERQNPAQNKTDQ
jgi:hypothetical protein